MSEFWVKKMKRYFSLLDIDGDGVLTKRDFELLGERFCENEKVDSAQQERIRRNINNIWKIFSKLAETGKNLVTELVFIESIKNQRHTEEVKASLTEVSRSVMQVLDTNEDGFLQEDEHRRLFESIGIPNVASFAKIAFDVIDINHDGKLSKDEFTTGVLDFVLSEDEKSPYRFFLGPLE